MNIAVRRIRYLLCAIMFVALLLVLTALSEKNLLLVLTSCFPRVVLLLEDVRRRLSA